MLFVFGIKCYVFVSVTEVNRILLYGDGGGLGGIDAFSIFIQTSFVNKVSGSYFYSFSSFYFSYFVFFLITFVMYYNLSLGFLTFH